jgi:hypothetical protein
MRKRPLHDDEGRRGIEHRATHLKCCYYLYIRKPAVRDENGEEYQEYSPFVQIANK